MGNQTVNQRSDGVFSDTKELLAACRRQEKAHRVWDQMLSDLARGLLINVLDPDWCCLAEVFRLLETN